MGHDRRFTILTELQLRPGRPNRAAWLARRLKQAHHTMPLRAADRLEIAWLQALPALFSGDGLARAERLVPALLRGVHPLHPNLRIPITSDIPRWLGGDDLARAQVVLRALRPSRVPGLTPLLQPHSTALRTLLRHVDSQAARLVTWVVM